VRPKTAKAPGGDRPMFQGSAAEIRDDLRAYETLGVSHVIFDAAQPDLKSVLQNMERFARDVRPIVATGSRAGGLAKKRRGPVVARATRPARAEGGLAKKRRAPFVARGTRPARAEGGLGKKRRGAAPATLSSKKRR
jgi:hypothetical protein